MRYTLTAVAAGLLAWIAAGRLLSPPAVDVSAPTIEQIQPLAELVTTRVHVTDALSVSLEGYTGRLRAVLVVHGDAQVGVDLARGRIEQIDHHNRTAVIVLPRPEVNAARIDHERTRVFAIVADGLWVIAPTDAGRAELIDRGMRQAQRSLTEAVRAAGVIEQARRRTETLVCAFMADSLDWSVTVRWLDEADS